MISEITLKWGLQALGVAYNRELSRDLEMLYRQSLSDLSDESFRAAVANTIKSERFFPSPAVLLEKAAESEVPSYQEFPALPPAEERKANASDGFEVFKRELRKHGVDVDELIKARTIE